MYKLITHLVEDCNINLASTSEIKLNIAVIILSEKFIWFRNPLTILIRDTPRGGIKTTFADKILKMLKSINIDSAFGMRNMYYRKK